MRRARRVRLLTVAVLLSWLGQAASGAATGLAFGGRRREQRQSQSQPQKQLTAAVRQSLFHEDRRKYFSMTAFAGAISTSITHSMVLPLDVMKTALQTDASLAGPRHAALAMLRAGKGIAPFFNGLRATAIGYWMQGATKFGGYEYLKRSAFDALLESGDVGAEIARRFQLPIMLASAAAAELFASAALCPLEVIKLRMQTSPELAALGLRRALLHVAKGDGLQVLYKGFVPIALRQVPYTACKLVSFELLASLIGQMLERHNEGRATRGESPLHLPRTAVVLASGLLAGAAAAVVSQPFDLLLTRLCGSTSVASLSSCVIADNLGSQLAYLVSLGSGAFTGLAPRLAMISVMTSCQFFLYDSLRMTFNCKPPSDVLLLSSKACN